MAYASIQCFDKEGEEVTDTERIRKGEYLVIWDYMLTHNWENLTLAEFEETIIFELVHIIRGDPKGNRHGHSKYC